MAQGWWSGRVAQGSWLIAVLSWWLSVESGLSISLYSDGKPSIWWENSAAASPSVGVPDPRAPFSHNERDACSSSATNAMARLSRERWSSSCSNSSFKISCHTNNTNIKPRISSKGGREYRVKAYRMNMCNHDSYQASMWHRCWRSCDNRRHFLLGGQQLTAYAYVRQIWRVKGPLPHSTFKLIIDQKITVNDLLNEILIMCVPMFDCNRDLPENITHPPLLTLTNCQIGLPLKETFWRDLALSAAWLSMADTPKNECLLPMPPIIEYDGPRNALHSIPNYFNKYRENIWKHFRTTTPCVL